MNSANIFIIILGTLTVVSSAQVLSKDSAASHQGHNDEFQRDPDITVEEDSADSFKEDKEIQLPINDTDFTDVQLKELENVNNFVGALETLEDAETRSASRYTTSCPNYWHGFNNKCYRAYFSGRSWYSARNYCRTIGGSLATSDTSQLNSFIATNVAARKERLWIGLNDLGREGQFHWVENNKHLHGYSAWDSGQPDNHKNREDCVQINYHSTGHWNDDHCGDSRGFVCQKNEA